MVRNYIKRETAAFFGVDPMQEEAQRARWVDRRKRLATRRYGDLKDEYAIAPSLPSTPVTPVTPYAMQSRLARPDVLPQSGTQDVTDAARWEEPPVRRKESVAKMTFSGVAYVVSRLARQRAREPTLSRTLSRSIQPAAQSESATPSVRYRAQSPTLCSVQEPFFDVLTRDSRDLGDGGGAAAPSGELSHLLDSSAAASAPAPAAAAMQQRMGVGDAVDSNQSMPYHFQHRDRQPKWARQNTFSSGDSSSREVGMSRIGNSFLERAFDNSDRRQYGMGVVGKLFGRSLKRSVARQPRVREQLEDIEDHRPYFTYWVTTVQILILFISIACYGFGTIGFNLNQRSGLVLTTSLSLKQVDYSEPANFWIGPRAADLIHLGAKFAPCMRKDIKILKEIDESRLKERNTACCIRNDESGCVQSSRSDCSYTIETWKKWSNGNVGPGGRISGSVCGLDPKYCEAPASIAPYEWPDDITKWPICRKTNSRGSPQRRFQYKDKAAEHMVCEVIGHPCCIGIHGSCEITTKEYCDFVRGYFHEEASLCSQVSCLDDVCGMIPFLSPEIPDQFYRLWTSLFLHAGLFHLVITIVIQYFLMRDLEKLTGAFRIGVIYMGSGVAGNLASAIFVPYRAEVGPAGAQFGLLACLIVEVLNVWPMLKRPGHAMLRLLGITLFLFVLGLVPWIDNYAHLFGFIFGFLLSYALLPYVSFGTYDRQRKIALIWVCLLSCLFLFAALFALFYVIPVYDCEICTYFNCLPLTRDFCAEQNINLKRDDGLV
ncbi:inactive rhomboid protein 1 isoform X2 [Thrips palmi]|uniref:Inactive rhomboid protein 1 isoform X2 n=1 Tax=Thrips palmi TaxID=161013 RepID=A0A6P8ZRD7_THRPL|nr:inactive rhomboid protein 1 isoform X2 [Thrips palmi]